MRERNEFILADLISLRAEQKPDLDVLTFEHLSLDDGATPDEVRSYADLHANSNRIAAQLIRYGMNKGDRFAIMMCNHPEFVEAMIAASITGCVFVPIDPRTRGDKLAYMAVGFIPQPGLDGRHGFPDQFVGIPIRMRAAFNNSA